MKSDKIFILFYLSYYYATTISIINENILNSFNNIKLYDFYIKLSLFLLNILKLFFEILLLFLLKTLLKIINLLLLLLLLSFISIFYISLF